MLQSIKHDRLHHKCPVRSQTFTNTTPAPARDRGTDTQDTCKGTTLRSDSCETAHQAMPSPAFWVPCGEAVLTLWFRGPLSDISKVSCSVVSDSLRPGLQPARLLCPRDSPGKNTGVGCHFLLQEVFLTQGLNLSFLLGRQILDHASLCIHDSATLSVPPRLSSHCDSKSILCVSVPSLQTDSSALFFQIPFTRAYLQYLCFCF